MQASTDFWLSGASGAASLDRGEFIDVDPPVTKSNEGPPRGPGPRPKGPMFIWLVLALALAAMTAIYVANRNSADTTQTTSSDVIVAATTAPATNTTPTNTAPTNVTVTAPTAAPATARTMIGDQPLTLRGMGALETGMSLAQVEAAIGMPVAAYADAGVPCQYGYLNGDPNSPRLMVIAEDGIFPLGKVVRIDLNPSQATRSGIRIGSTKADVLAAYGDQIEITPHKYFTEAGSEYLTFMPRDSADADYRLVIETRSDAVVEIRSGLVPFVQQVEGCS